MLRLTRLALVAGALGGLLVETATAADKSYQFRGRRITLAESPDYLLVRSKGVKATDAVATQAIRAQAKALGQDTPLPLALLAKHPPQFVKVLGGVLVPKLTGVRETHHAAIAAAGEGIDEVQTVYRAGEQQLVPLNTLTVRYKGKLNPRQLFALASELDLEEAGRPKSTAALVRYRVPAGADVFALCEKLSTRGYIEWAEPDMAVQLIFAADPPLPNDTKFGQQWHMQPGVGNVRVPEAWQLSRGTSNITVAVIDSGIDLAHPELQPNLVAGYDFIDNDETPQPDTGEKQTSPHGTACAGMVAAVSSNGRGIAAPAPNAKIMPVRVAGADGFVSFPDLAKALRWSAEHGAKILSCSWGAGVPSNDVADALDEVTTAGCLVFVAAGNSGPTGDVLFPAQLENAVAVGATTAAHKLAEFSSFTPGKLVDISAPGADVLTSDMLGKEGYNDGTGQPSEDGDDPGNYTRSYGTSFACPMTAGVAALVWSTYPKLTNVQVRQVLLESAQKIDAQADVYDSAGYSDRYGFGQVDALAALTRAKEISGEDSAQSPPQLSVPSANPDRTVPPVANAREMLEALLRLRKNEDNGGRPKTVKDLPNPKTVLLRRDQLAQVLEPQPQSYSVRGYKVELTPSTAWFVIAVDEGGEVMGEQFWQVVRRDATKAQLESVSIAAQGAGKIAVVAPRALLRDHKELDEHVRNASLPAVYPVYEHQGGLLVPLGTLTLRLAADASDTAKAAVQTQIAALGLRPVKEDGDVRRFALGDTSSEANLFAAVAALEKLEGVKWCEPDFASRAAQPLPK